MVAAPRPRQEVRIRMRGFGKYKGYSDLVPTYCCSASPCYYIEFPALSYGGYFACSDVRIVRRKKHG